MSPSPAAQAFRQYYTEMQMERGGLFATMAREYGCSTLLYPGSSFHITPSFHFRHVVYVDRSAEAQAFFAASAEVLRIVNERKQYPQAPFVRFLARDFTEELPLQEGSYDLLLALYAGGIARACQRYLGAGGLLLTNNHQDDAGQAAAAGLRLIAVIEEKHERYVVRRNALETYLVARQKVAPDRAYVRESTPWPAYTRNADYYVFQKLR